MDLAFEGIDDLEWPVRARVFGIANVGEERYYVKSAEKFRKFKTVRLPKLRTLKIPETRCV